MVRLAEHGLLPTIASSPSSMQFQLWSRATSMLIGRQEFTDLRALLVKHIDFKDLPTLVDAESPTLLLGAGDISEGSFKIFSSALGEISIDSVLASAAIPNLFPAVEIGRARLLGRDLRLEPSGDVLLAGAADGEGEDPRRDLGHSGQSHAGGRGFRRRRARSPIGATIWPGT